MNILQSITYCPKSQISILSPILVAGQCVRNMASSHSNIRCQKNRKMMVKNMGIFSNWALTIPSIAIQLHGWENRIETMNLQHMAGWIIGLKP